VVIKTTNKKKKLRKGSNLKWRLGSLFFLLYLSIPPAQIEVDTQLLQGIKWRVISCESCQASEGRLEDR